MWSLGLDREGAGADCWPSLVPVSSWWNFLHETVSVVCDIDCDKLEPSGNLSHLISFNLELHVFLCLLLSPVTWALTCLTTCCFPTLVPRCS